MRASFREEGPRDFCQDMAVDQATPVHPHALAAWRWDPNSTPNVPDYNNATDGDLLIVWALSKAAARWNVTDDMARRIADALATEVVARSRFGLILLPAAKGFGPPDQRDRPVVNLSYWIFPALERLRAVSGKADWDAISKTGERRAKRNAFLVSQRPSRGAMEQMGHSQHLRAADLRRLTSARSRIVGLNSALSGIGNEQSALTLIAKGGADVRSTLTSGPRGLVVTLRGSISAACTDHLATCARVPPATCRGYPWSFGWVRRR
jgi:hypothetical protein